MRHSRNPQKGSLILVVLCLLAVLGIGLAAYLAVGNQSMKLSDRSNRTGLSAQLAEMGLEEAMRAFNKNDWGGWTTSGTSATWTISGTTATCALTFPATKFGQGVTGSVKIRIDNYNAAQLDSTWVGGTSYRVNDLVGYNGIWYRCVKTHSTSQTPSGMGSLAYWVPAPISWTWIPNYSYKTEDVINNNGVWYRCTASHTSPVTWTATNWILINSITLWSGSVSYVSDDIVYFGFNPTTWYLWNGSTWVTPGISWQWKAATSYNFNDRVCVYDSASSSYIWYRCILANTNQVPPNATYWENALSSSWAWSASASYNLSDVVYRSGSFYRCILAHTNQAPPNTIYWSTAPRLSRAWDSGKQYSQNDTVHYNGVQYFSLLNSNTGQNPATATTYWVGANTGTASYQWNVTTAYSAGNYKCYGGVWYKCLAANTGQSPNNTTYWTASWANSSGVTTGAPVVYAEGTVNFVGSPSIKTQLRATISPAPLFPNAAAATTTISANSGGTVNSYDSVTDPSASSPGYSAVLAAGSTSGTAITLGSTAVKGYLAAPSSTSSPYAPLYSSGGSVKGPSSPGSPNIDLTRISRSPYIPQFDPLPAGGLAANWASVPKGTALVLSATTNIGTPGATTPSRYYINGDLDLSSNTGYSILNINGPVTLYINGDLTMDSGSPNGKININTTGSAEIHIAGSLTVNIGSDGINNTTQDPKKLILICDTSASSGQNYSDATTPSVYGVFYLPNTTNASGLLIDNNSLSIYGAISAKKITYSGANMNIHYDTSLRYATFGGVDQPYAITEWRELTDATELATMP
jgi:hypothetical protein